MAGVLATAADFTLLYAPNINSYKRFAAGSFAPTAIAWGHDNRTCAVRLVGKGAGARMENRIPGADVNPYLATAAMLAGGLHGIEQGLELEPELVGNAYDSDKPHVPTTMTDARERLRRLRGRPGVLRRRGRRPLRQHGRRRAGGVRRRGHRLGAAPGVRAPVSTPADERAHALHRRQPGHRAAGRRRPTRRPGRHRRGDRASHEAFQSWKAVAPGERAALLRRFAAVVDAHVEELAELEVRNSGHTWGNARWEAGNVRDCLNYYSGSPERM